MHTLLPDIDQDLHPSGIGNISLPDHDIDWIIFNSTIQKGTVHQYFSQTGRFLCKNISIECTSSTKHVRRWT